MDRVQAWIRGELSEDEVGALQLELASDPELERWATQYRQVFHLTADGPLPECRTNAEDVAARVPRAHPLASLAAALVVGVLGAFWLERAESIARPDVVLLSSIPARTVSIERETSIPVRLASYEPVVDGEIRWVDDLAEARSLASATNRCLFVFGTYPDCPIAERVRKDCLSTAEVLAMTEEYVPFAIDLTSLSPEEHDELMRTGYPYLGVEAPSGESKLVFSGTFSESEFRAKLEAGLAGSGEPHLSWREARGLAASYERARAAEAEGRWSEAVQEYRRLMSSNRTSDFPRAGSEGLERAGSAARELLTQAQRLDPTAAEALLESSAASFRDTEYEADIARVLHALRERGVFPSLVWQSDSL